MNNPLLSLRCVKCLWSYVRQTATGTCVVCNGTIVEHALAVAEYRQNNPHLCIGPNFTPYDGPSAHVLGPDQLVVPIVAKQFMFGV